MDQEVLNALDGFEAVWQRVLSAGGGNEHTAQTAPGGDALAGAMALWETYTAIARQTGGEARARFASLAEEIRQTVRELQTEHFMRTGELSAPPSAPLFAPGVLTGMRLACERERELAGQLSDHAALAQAASRRAQALRDMIAGLLRQ